MNRDFKFTPRFENKWFLQVISDKDAEIAILRIQLLIAKEALSKLTNIPYNSPIPYYKDLARDALDEIEKVK